VERGAGTGFFGTINYKDYPASLRSLGNDSVDTTTGAVANVAHKFCVGFKRARFSSVAGARPKRPLLNGNSLR